MSTTMTLDEFRARIENNPKLKAMFEKAVTAYDANQGIADNDPVVTTAKHTVMMVALYKEMKLRSHENFEPVIRDLLSQPQFKSHHPH